MRSRSSKKSFAAVCAVALACATPLAGCTCGSKPPQRSDAMASASPVPSGIPSAVSLGEMSDAASAHSYSNPIGAARIANGAIVVAGLFASASAILVTGFRPNGAPEWTAEVFRGAVWSADAELRVLPAGDGVAVVWRGAVGDKVARYMTVVGPHGEPRGAAIEVGSALCATADGVAWIDREGLEPVRVRARAWGDTTSRELLQLPAEPMPTLACGDHQVHVIVDGEDDLRVTSVPAGEGGAPAPVVVSRDKDFGDDAEDDHKVFTAGDDVGLVRVAESGIVTVRELSAGSLSPWRKLKTRLAVDDDVIVAADADATTLLLVYAHDQSDLCTSAAVAKSLHLLRIDRKTGAESRSLLAGADCGKETGPFWIASVPRGAVAWVERAKRSDPNAAPIRALVSRALGADAEAASRVEQPSDAIVEAGCDATACYAAALVRDSGADGMAAEPVRILRF